MLRKTKKGFYVFKKLAQIPNLLHGFSTIDFGNMSSVHGKRSEVLRNRRRFAQNVGVNPKSLFSVNQVHGKKILLVGPGTSINRTGDGLMTKQKNLALLIKIADCLPILLFDPKKEVIALIHAGRQGVSLEIHLKAIAKMKENFDCRPREILVGLGPAICRRCYDKIDLTGSVLADFQKAGIKKKNIEEARVCTFENKDFFSHQRSKIAGEPKGRFAALLSWS